VAAPDAAFQKQVEEALALIGEAWPEAAAELHALVRAIVIVDGHGVRSSSVPAVFGAIFLCPRPVWTTLEVACLLVHECAHHSLEVKSAFLPFLENEGDTAISPLREELRPLWGVLHAAFVLVRVGHFARLVLATNRAAAHAEAVAERDDAAMKLAEAVAELERHARWTPAGQALFASIREGLAELRAASIGGGARLWGGGMA
jgi:HEXXH motif-containing protein